MSATNTNPLPKDPPDKKEWPDKIEISFLRGLLKMSIYHVTPNGLKLLKMLFVFLVVLMLIVATWKILKAS